MSAPDDSLHILVLHGPNMNLVGKRSKEVYGNLTLDKIDRSLRRKAQELDVQLKIFQSNSESELVTKLQRQRNWADGFLINPSTFCFTSYTLLDTLQLINLPAVEVHLTETIAGRSANESLLSIVCLRQIIGPVNGAYSKGLEALVKYIHQ